MAQSDSARTRWRDLDSVLKEAMATDKPVIVDVPTYPYENCYPMIPAGGCNHEMILEDPPELKKKQSQPVGDAGRQRHRINGVRGRERMAHR